MMELHDVVVVGAGLAGLTCARTLAAAGLRVVVADRSDRPGGRCSSKPAAAGTPDLDFGPVFLHGADPAFLDALSPLDGDRLAGWPAVVRGRGTPCQPAAFAPDQSRWALRSGMGGLGRRWAEGLDLRLGFEATAWTWEDDRVVVNAGDGRTLAGRTVVFALALEQSAGLLSRAAGPAAPAVASARALLGAFGSLPSLVVLARYPAGAPVPDWDVWYPEDSPNLLLLSNEGRKREDPEGRVSLVLQARPGWASSRMEGDRDAWARTLLDEAARLAGPWAGRPEAWRSHRWKYGRLAPSDHLAAPMLLGRPGSTARLGLVGDLFDNAGGLEGAWRSGTVLARRLLI